VARFLAKRANTRDGGYHLKQAKDDTARQVAYYQLANTRKDEAQHA
jgi:hypothetical protein